MALCLLAAATLLLMTLDATWEPYFGPVLGYQWMTMVVGTAALATAWLGWVATWCRHASRRGMRLWLLLALVGVLAATLCGSMMHGYLAQAGRLP